MSRIDSTTRNQIKVEGERRRLEATCQILQVAEHTDFVCIAPQGHAGEHSMVDCMGLRGLDESGHPVYTRR